MAEQNTQVSSLQSILATSLEFLKQPGGAYRVLANLRSYPVFEPFLNQHKKELARAFMASNSVEAENILTKAMADMVADIKNTPPQVLEALGRELQLTQKKREGSPVPIDFHQEGRPEAYGMKIQDAREITQQTIAALNNKYRTQRQKIIINVVDNWVKELKIDSSQKTYVRQKISESILNQCATNPMQDSGEITKNAIGAVNLPNTQETLSSRAGKLEYLVREVNEPIQKAAETIATNVASSLVPDESALKWKNSIEQLEIRNVAHIDEEIQRVVPIVETQLKIDKTSGIIIENPEAIEKIVRSDFSTNNTFFQSMAQTPWQKVMAPLADTITSALGPGTLDDFIEKILGEKITIPPGKSITAPNGMPLPPGSKQTIRTIIPQPPVVPQKEAVSGVRRIMQKFAVNMFYPLYSIQIRDTVISVLLSPDAVRSIKSPVELYSLVLSARSTWESIWSVGKRAGKTGVDLAAAEGKSFLSRILGGLIGKGAGAGAATAGATAAGGIFAGPVGAALMWFGSEVVLKGLSFVASGILKLFDPNKIAAFFTGFETPGEKMKWTDTIVLLPIILCVAPILLIFFTLFNNTVQDSAQVISLPKEGEATMSNGGGEGLSEAQRALNRLRAKIGGWNFTQSSTNMSVPEFTYPPCDETTQNCGWPVSECHDNNGKKVPCCVTQGPFGPSTHSLVSAIDIDGNLGDPITSNVTGKIISITNSYPIGFVGVGYTPTIYGNNVVIETTLMEGGVQKTITVKYAHLAGISPSLVEDQMINFGDSIGVMGDTGVGLGNYHLHLEVKGGSVNSILPQSVPGCGYKQGECNNKICW